ncbi:hypothetical protein DVS28_a0352 [Euzebya pacifica]|uniref:Uncharacterized protein n=1 Tax=Euzebya pacifica TaxID=1608957 RepID=A0A346XS62_9ACTN|nr:hypothetical protein DVS28_a0352 [Euzebya pacifica]
MEFRQSFRVENRSMGLKPSLDGPVRRDANVGWALLDRQIATDEDQR